MVKQRDAVRMSDGEIRAFLDSAKTLVVATLAKEGGPHLTALWFAPYDGAVIFETYGASQKVVNLRRDPRVAVLCEQGETYDELRGVSITGRATIVDDGPRLKELMEIIIRRNTPGMATDAIASHVNAMVRKRVVVVVHAEKTISWDHRKLADR